MMKRYIFYIIGIFSFSYVHVVSIVTDTVPNPNCTKNNCTRDLETLILVHALFRHGDRTNEKLSSWTTDPYKNETFYPYGWGQLTNKGKRTEYNLGKLLRKRYINFLGNTWTPEVIDARSTNINRTKMSLELVLAGLFPPVEQQMFLPGLFWQPIPYNYVEFEKDNVLLPMYICPKFRNEYNTVTTSPEYLAEIKKYKSIFDYLSLHSGDDIKGYSEAQLLYYGLLTTQEWGNKLPIWTKPVFPVILKKFAIRAYEIATATTNLKRILSGALIKKILDDTRAKLDGSLIPPERKLFLYSAHEINIAYLLRALGIFDRQIPPYGGCVMIEIHKINGELGVKIYYENYTASKPKLLTLPGCSSFCPLTKFETIVADLFPTADSCKYTSKAATEYEIHQ